MIAAVRTLRLQRDDFCTNQKKIGRREGALRVYLFIFVSVVFGAVGLISSATSSSAQDVWVRESTFCKKLKDNTCEPDNIIVGGQSVDIEELDSDKEGPILYFHGKIRNHSRRLISAFYAREADCIEENDHFSVGKKRVPQPDWVKRLIKEATTFFFSLTPKDILGRLSAKQADINFKPNSVIDIRATFVGLDESDDFPAFTHRNIFCVGPLIAWWVDTKADPLEPLDNNIKTIYITDRHNRLNRKIVELEAR